jgi:hypothetical protein
MGAINWFLMALMLGTPEAQVSRVGRCLENMTDVQVAAIIDKWLREHPERWHYGLHSLYLAEENNLPTSVFNAAWCARIEVFVLPVTDRLHRKWPKALIEHTKLTPAR